MAPFVVPLVRTREALRQYDEARVALLALKVETKRDADKSCALVEALERADVAVGEAFALDMDGVRDTENARLMRAGPFLRHLVERAA